MDKSKQLQGVPTLPTGIETPCMYTCLTLTVYSSIQGVSKERFVQYDTLYMLNALL